MNSGDLPSAGSSLKNFVSEKEIEDRRQKRQEEWKKVRKPDEPLECPEEDTRSLFERLQEQKFKKDEEYEEEQKIRNSVKGLGEDEVSFLNFVSKQQEKLQKQRDKEQASIVQELKDAAVSKIDDGKKETKLEEKKIPRLQVGASKSKSQAQLLMGAVKRKASSPEKKSEGDEKKKESSSTQEDEEEANIPQAKTSRSDRPYVKYILPSIGPYHNPSSDSETSSSEDSELDAPCFLTSALHNDHELKRMAVISAATGFQT